MNTYEPGRICVATVRGVPNVRVFRYATRTYGFRWMELNTGIVHSDEQVTDIRPLVVMLENFGTRTDLSPLVNLLRDDYISPLDRATSRSMADQIEAAVKPPHIPEPDLGKHVTAGKPDGTRAEFVRVGSRHWSEIGNGSGWEWADLIDPEAVSA
jgi:hypothetical protein